MIETGKINLEDLPPPKKVGRKRKYPWDLLKEPGDYFIWGDEKDEQSIRTNSKFQDITVTCKFIDKKFHVIRVA